jgi:hypothetical protein
MQSLEDPEHLLVILPIDTDAVVFDAEQPITIALVRDDSHVYPQWPRVVSVLERIAEKILKQLH